MNKNLRKLLIWSAAFLLVTLLLLVGFAALFEDAIGARILREVNKDLLTPLTADRVRFSFLSEFPNPSAELTGVRLGGAVQEQPILEAELLSVRLGLRALLNDHIHIKGIHIENGSVQIVQSDWQGRSNINIFQTDADSQNAARPMTLSLDRATLRDVDLLYLDASTGSKIRAIVNNAVLSGKLKGKRLALHADASLYSRYAEIGGVRYAVGKSLSCDAELEYNLESSLLKMDDCTLGIEGTGVKVDGWLIKTGNGMTMDLSASSSKGSVGAVFGLFPPKTLKSLTGMESAGTFSLNLKAKGRLSKYSIPEITGEVSLEKGRVTTDLLAYPLRDVSFQAAYTNGRNHNSESSMLNISNFKGYFNREWIEANLAISNFDNMYINADLNGIIPVETLIDLMPDSEIATGSGELEFKNLTVKGRYADMIRMSNMSKVHMKGAVVFDDAAIELNNHKLIVDRGEMEFDGNQFVIKDIHLEGPETDLRLEATASNLLPVLLADSQNSRQAELRFDGRLHATQLNIDKLLDMVTVPFVDGDLSEPQLDSLRTIESMSRHHLTGLLNGSFEAIIEEFTYHGISGTSFAGEVNIQDRELGIRGSANSMGGEIEMEGVGYLEKEAALSLKLSFTGVDVNEMFARTDNFGQNVLTSKHLMGTLDAHLAVEARWDESGHFLYDKLRVLSDVSIRDGELRDFELLYDYSDYVDIEELRNIRFTTLKNWLEIKDGRIFIPVMFIQSTAINLTVSGEHTFDQAIDYYIKINAGQVLATKLTSKQSTGRLLPAKRTDWFNVYIHVFGYVESFTHEKNARNVKAWFARSEKRKENIQRKLMESFGPTITLEEPVSWKDDIPEYQEEMPQRVDYLEEIDAEGEKDGGKRPYE